MEEEKKDEQPSENAVAEETKENKENETPEQNEDNQEIQPEVEEIDYKVELDKAKSIIAHKESVIQDEKARRKELEQSVVQEDNTDELSEFKKKQEEELEKLKYSIVEDKIEEEIGSLAKNDSEADLIRFHIKNSVKFGYTVREVKDAVKTAWLKANEKRILSTNKELAEALKKKQTVNTSQNSSGQPIGNKKDDLTKVDKEFLRHYGAKV